MAEEAVEDLADLFRANLRETRTQIPLKEELEVGPHCTSASRSCAWAHVSR